MRKERPDYSENIFAEFNAQYLQYLYQRSKKEFVDFLDLFNLDANNVIGDE